MRPPASLGDAGRAAWRDASRVVVAIGEDPALCKAALFAFARAADDVARVRHDWEADGGDAFAVGGTTGRVVVPHPALAAIDQAEKRLAACAERLGLDPQARRKLARRVGRPSGAASAPDRAAPPRRRLRVAGGDE